MPRGKKNAVEQKPVEKIFRLFVSPDWRVVDTIYNQKPAVLIVANECSPTKQEGLVEITVK